MTSLPAPEPSPTPETEPFWQAAAEGRLVVPRCDRCAAVIWYPRRFCPECHGFEVSWVEASGLGTVHSFTVVRQARGPWKEALPYVLAYVELEEGPRVLTNIVDADPDAVAIGQPVAVVFEPTPGGSAIPRFRPAPSSSSGQAAASSSRQNPHP